MARRKKLLIIQTICLFVALISLTSVFFVTMAAYTKKTTTTGTTTGSLARVEVDVGNVSVNNGYYVYTLSSGKAVDFEFELFNSGDVDTYTKINFDVGVMYGETDLTDVFKYNNFFTINNKTYSESVVENTNDVLTLESSQTKGNGVKINFTANVNSTMPSSFTVGDVTYDFAAGSYDLELYIKYDVAAIQKPYVTLTGAELEGELDSMLPEVETITFTLESSTNGTEGEGAKILANGAQLIGVTHAWDVSATENDNVLLYLTNSTTVNGNYDVHVVGTGDMISTYTNGSQTPYADLRNYFNTITVYEGITTIGQYMFHSCQNVNKITLPQSIVYLRQQCFRNSYNMNVFDFSNCINLKTIEHGVVGFCGTVNEILLPASLTSVLEHPFLGSDVKKITIDPNSTKYQLINDCFVNTSNGYLLEGYEWSTIPTTSNIHTLGSYAFYQKLTNADSYMIIPSNIKTIRYGALYKSACSIFIEHTSSSGFTTLDSNAFLDSTSPIYYYSETANYDGAHWRYVNGKPKVWEDYALTGSGAGASLTINGTAVENVTHAWDVSATEGAMDAILYLTSTDSGATYAAHLVGDGDTYNKTYSAADLKTSGIAYQVTSLNIQNGITKIGSYMFYTCSQLSEVVVPNTVREIAAGAFCNMPSLASVVFEENSQLTTIGTEAFATCNLTTITLPKTLTTLTHGILFNNKNLTEIIVEEGCTNFKVVDGCLVSMDGTCLYDTVITGFTIPNGVKSIQGYALRGRTQTEIVLPSTTTYLGIHALRETPITQIVIPSSVNSIQTYVFYNCTNLTSIFMEHTSESDITTLNSGWLTNCNATVYWYSETEQAGYWHYVNDVPTLW